MDMCAKTLERYQKIEKVGEGTYGEVFKARDNITNEFVALKKVRLENETQGIPATSMREISALKELEHPNIVKLVDLICGENKLYLVFEFITEDLRRFLKRDSSPLAPKTIKFIFFQILHAVCHCHSSGIIHRDLKPHNILINEKGLIKIADFGLARTYITPFRTYTHEALYFDFHWSKPILPLINLRVSPCFLNRFPRTCISIDPLRPALSEVSIFVC